MTENGDPQRAVSFDANADLYDRTRPSYPDALYDDLLSWLGAPPPVRVLELGAGTGKATAALVARGCAVTAVEPGPSMAAFISDRMPEVDVRVCTFEDADLGDQTFDLVACAQSWHWIDHERAVPRIAALLGEGGAFAAWWAGHTSDTSPVIAQVRQVFDDQFGAGTVIVDPQRLPVDAIARSPLFGDVERCTFPMTMQHRSAEYLELVQTYSDVAVLDPATRAALLDRVAAVIDAAGGVVEQQADVTLFRARVR